MEWIKKYGLFIGIGVFIWLIGFVLIISNNKKLDEENDTVIEKPVIEEKHDEVVLGTIEIPKYKVDIKGYVKKPGVYEVEEGAIVNDVINLAGGLKSGATTKNINLSKKIKDEMVIYIYTNNELKKYESAHAECKCDDVVITSCEGSSIITSEAPTSSSSEQNSKININTASIEELMKLSGVGEAKAKAIIEYREKNGKFNTIEDIKNVSGIGEAAYQKIKDNITV